MSNFFQASIMNMHCTCGGCLCHQYVITMVYRGSVAIQSEIIAFFHFFHSDVPKTRTFLVSFERLACYLCCIAMHMPLKTTLVNTEGACNIRKYIKNV